MRHPLQMISWYIIVSLIFGGVFIFFKTIRETIRGEIICYLS